MACKTAARTILIRPSRSDRRDGRAISFADSILGSTIYTDYYIHPLTILSSLPSAGVGVCSR